MSLPRGKGVFFVFRASQAHSWPKRGNSSKLLSWMKGINGCCPVRSLALDPKPPFLEQCVRAPLCGFEAPMNIQSSHDDHDMQKMGYRLICLHWPSTESNDAIRHDVDSNVAKFQQNLLERLD